MGRWGVSRSTFREGGLPHQLLVLSDLSRALWTRNANYAEVLVEDEGPGLPNTANLFVPFFTTKPGGSEIGLVLSRQIAEAHGGSLALQNRASGRGCEARLRLPR